MNKIILYDCFQVIWQTKYIDSCKGVSYTHIPTISTYISKSTFVYSCVNKIKIILQPTISMVLHPFVLLETGSYTNSQHYSFCLQKNWELNNELWLMTLPPQGQPIKSSSSALCLSIIIEWRVRPWDQDLLGACSTYWPNKTVEGGVMDSKPTRWVCN